MTETKPNSDWLYAFMPFSEGARLGQRAEAAGNAINEHAAALQDLFVSQTQSGCDRIFHSVGRLSGATSTADRMNILSSIVTESSRTHVDNLATWARLYLRHYTGLVGSLTGNPSSPT
ncbi:MULTISPECIES: hypothetical protein [unclassified Novosphingobium]|uniref:hypothetical protein n=1 Tax=unclassified Novosphingobium TaxID=2644732 RepID=UPI001359B760|nr:MULTISPECIES: hypothetical protein [unclassified Novosphingobium]